MKRFCLFLTLAVGLQAQVLLPSSQTQPRPRVFSIAQGQVTPAEPEKPAVASAPIPAEPPAPTLEVVSDGWQLKELAREGAQMDDGFARPVAVRAVAVTLGPQRGQQTVITTHQAWLKMADAQKIRPGVREFVYNPPLMMVSDARAWDKAEQIPASAVRTVVDSDGKVVRQEMALLGAQLGSAGVFTPQGVFLAGEENPMQAGFCPVGSPAVGAVFAVEATQMRGLAVPQTWPLWPQGRTPSMKALAVDAVNGCYYVAGQGALYRWRPNAWDNPALGGRLEILSVERPKEGLADGQFAWSVGRLYAAAWVPLENVKNIGETPYQLGAVMGIASRGGEVWMSQQGRAEFLVLKNNKLTVVALAGGPAQPAALCASPTGELLAVDAKAPCRVMLLTREGQWKTLLKANEPQARLAGLALSPDGHWVWVGINGGQKAGLVALQKL